MPYINAQYVPQHVADAFARSNENERRYQKIGERTIKSSEDLMRVVKTNGRLDGKLYPDGRTVDDWGRISTVRVDGFTFLGKRERDTVGLAVAYIVAAVGLEPGEAETYVRSLPTKSTSSSWLLYGR